MVDARSETTRQKLVQQQVIIPHKVCRRSFAHIYHLPQVQNIVRCITGGKHCVQCTGGSSTGKAYIIWDDEPHNVQYVHGSFLVFGWSDGCGALLASLSSSSSSSYRLWNTKRGNNTRNSQPLFWFILHRKGMIFSKNYHTNLLSQYIVAFVRGAIFT